MTKQTIHENIELSIPCECGNEAQQVGGEMLYPHRPDLFKKRFYLCDCGNYVGSHYTGKALGTPANAGTRKARNNAHRSFDKLWAHKHKTFRSEVYKQLAEFMNIESSNCHIAMFNEEQCRQVLEFCDQYVS